MCFSPWPPGLGSPRVPSPPRAAKDGIQCSAQHGNDGGILAKDEEDLIVFDDDDNEDWRWLSGQTHQWELVGGFKVLPKQRETTAQAKSPGPQTPERDTAVRHVTKFIDDAEHASLSKSETTSFDQSDDLSGDDLPAANQCPKCEAVFDSPHELYWHQRDKYHFQCHYCGLCAPEPESLYQHLLRSHPEDQHLECPGCNEVFKHVSDFWVHIQLEDCPGIPFLWVVKNREKMINFEVGLHQLSSGMDELFSVGPLRAIKEDEGWGGESPDVNPVALVRREVVPTRPIISTPNAYRVRYRIYEFPLIDSALLAESVARGDIADEDADSSAHNEDKSEEDESEGNESEENESEENESEKNESQEDESQEDEQFPHEMDKEYQEDMVVDPSGWRAYSNLRQRLEKAQQEKAKNEKTMTSDHAVPVPVKNVPPHIALLKAQEESHHAAAPPLKNVPPHVALLKAKQESPHAVPPTSKKIPPHIALLEAQQEMTAKQQKSAQPDKNVKNVTTLALVQAKDNKNAKQHKSTQLVKNAKKVEQVYQGQVHRAGTGFSDEDLTFKEDYGFPRWMVDPDHPAFAPKRFLNRKMRLYVCPHPRCRLTYPTPREFADHMRSQDHGLGGGLRCIACQATFPTVRGVISHMESSLRCDARRFDDLAHAMGVLTGGLINVDRNMTLGNGDVKFVVDTRSYETMMRKNRHNDPAKARTAVPPWYNNGNRDKVRGLLSG
ncbi:hypothetical protein F5Y17DRAFT_462414 [Xylariaceae sp. FL0594]|nr:hypothetical protein F5Y17DRAFT_462414 [Xylariaceae sp. FL0594]